MKTYEKIELLMEETNSGSIDTVNWRRAVGHGLRLARDIAKGRTVKDILKKEIVILKG